MKEEYIKFETAKLAKEKGFAPFPYTACYSSDGMYWKFNGPYEKHTEVQGRIGTLINPDVVSREKHIPATTQSLLQKWLREVHDIDIEIEHIQYPGKRVYVGSTYSDRVEEESGDYVEFDTYEEALEDCLKDALSIIP